MTDKLKKLKRRTVQIEIVRANFIKTKNTMAKIFLFLFTYDIRKMCFFCCGQLLKLKILNLNLLFISKLKINYVLYFISECP